MANTQRGKLLNIVILILFTIVIGLIAKGIYSKQLQLRELQNESSLLDKKISNVKKNIRNIKRQIKMAKNDPYYIKHEMADRYLIVSKDETVIIFNDNSSQNK